MPFTPKFVDMVRNLTTVTGTGAISLGSAVSGFTSLTDAVASGDQFYYCIQGVDKPAEREVGRGTMQANGTIARQTISGPLTNFTTGTKTIALVTAAEWFAKIEAGGSGGSSPTVPGLAELAALPTASGAAAMLTAKGRDGLFVFDPSNLSARVAIDTRKGITVAPAAAPSGASGAWVRAFDGPVHLSWFGPAADFVTDDLPVFDAAQAVIKSLRFGGVATPALELGAHRYYLGNTYNIHIPMRIIGAGGGGGIGCGTLLRFAKNVSGIVFNYTNTHGDGAGTQGNAEGSSMEGVQIWGGNVNVDSAGNVTTYAAGDSTIGHGIRIRCTFVALTDVSVLLFGGSGFNINATAGSGAATNGNANNFILERCSATYNRGSGFEIAGTDANAGTINSCSSISNGGAGFLDYSFLGNSYLMCHVRDCGVDDPTTAGTGTGGPTGTCQYPAASGSFYYMVAGQEAAASTVVPGTNLAVWRPFGGHPQCKTWVSGLTWVNPSPYATNPANVNGRNVFIGCYAESAQAPIQATNPSLFLGGLLDEVTVDGTASWVRGTDNGGLNAGEFISRNAAGTEGTYFGHPDGDRIFVHQRSGPTYAELRGRDDYNGKKALELRLDNSFEALNVGLEATHPNGYGSVAIARLFVGDGSLSATRRIQLCASLAALNGQAMLKGDVYIHYNALSGDPPAYMCTVAGTYGSGALLSPLAPLGLAEASAAEIRAASSASRFVSPARLFDAAAPVTLTDGATVTIDGSAGINFNLTLGGSRTLANPVNMKPGQSGRIRVKQDATGSRTLAFGTNWLFAGGDPTMTSTPSAIDVIAYFANSATEIEASIVKALS